jgi:hypothetical protein
MLTQSGTQQRCARPRGVCRPKQQCNKPSATLELDQIFTIMTEPRASPSRSSCCLLHCWTLCRPHAQIPGAPGGWGRGSPGVWALQQLTHHCSAGCSSRRHTDTRTVVSNAWVSVKWCGAATMHVAGFAAALAAELHLLPVGGLQPAAQGMHLLRRCHASTAQMYWAYPCMGNCKGSPPVVKPPVDEVHQLGMAAVLHLRYKRAQHGFKPHRAVTHSIRLDTPPAALSNS